MAWAVVPGRISHTHKHTLYGGLSHTHNPRARFSRSILQPDTCLISHLEHALCDATLQNPLPRARHHSTLRHYSSTFLSSFSLSYSHLAVPANVFFQPSTIRIVVCLRVRSWFLGINTYLEPQTAGLFESGCTDLKSFSTLLAQILEETMLSFKRDVEHSCGSLELCHSDVPLKKYEEQTYHLHMHTHIRLRDSGTL